MSRTALIFSLASSLLILLAVPGLASFPIAIQAVCDLDSPTCVDGIQGLGGARGIALSPDDKHLYVVSSSDSSLVVFARDAVDGRTVLVQTVFDGAPGIDGLASASGVTVSPDGQHVYTAATLDSAVAVWSRNSATGAVTLVEVQIDDAGGVDGLAGAHSVAVSPDGSHVYVASRGEGAVAVFARDAATGALAFLEVELDGAGPNDGLAGAEAVAVSPDGKHVYVASEIDDAVAVFARQTAPGAADFGELTFVEAQFDGAGLNDGLAGAGALALDSNGDNVYVASERGALDGIAGDDWLAVFARDPSTGALTFVESFDESDFGIFGGCTGAGNENSGVAVSPDDSMVLLTNPFQGAVASFTRSGVDGSLTFLDSVCDRKAGAEGLAGVIGLAVSADGARAYTTSSAFDLVTTLCTGGPDPDLTDTGVVASEVTEIGCRSIVAGGSVSGYEIVAPGDVTFLAPLVTLTSGFSVGIDAKFAITSSLLGSPASVPPVVDVLQPSDGEGVLPDLQIDIGYRVEDDRLIDSYQLSAGGELLVSATAVNQVLVEGTAAWLPPSSAQAGDTFPIRLEATDFNGGTSVDQILVEVPSGTVLTGDQTLDSSYDGQSLVLADGTFTVLEPLSLASLNLVEGAVVKSVAGEALDLTVAGELRIGSGAAVDVTGQGFAGGTPGSPEGGAPPGIAGSQTNAGGSHGGTGSRGSGPGVAGEVYDSVYAPSLGGGGGANDEGTCCAGYAGGGVVLLDVGTLVLDGEIRSRGFSTGSLHFVTGAGGTVSVTAESVSGAGTIDASGGDQAACYAGVGVGGGGRVALSVDVLGGFDPATQITARGGFNGCSSTSSSRRGAAPGTIYVSLAGDPFGRLLVDAGEYANGDDLPGLATALPELGGGPVAATEVSGPDLWVTGGAAFLTRWRGAWMALVDATGAELGTFEVAEIDLAGRARLAGAGGVAGAASYRGEYRFDELRLVNGGDLSASDALSVTSVIVDAGASALPRRLSAVDVTLLAGSVASAVSEGTVEASISGTLTIEAGATLDVTGQGFAGGTPGSPEGGAPPGIAGSQMDAGGSHGGTGSKGGSPGAAGEVYDSVYAPSLGGGGGANDEGSCCAGYAGGGVVLLDVGTLVLDGEIRSRGFSTGSIHIATGAGGTISVMAETLSGAGTIDASGGDQSACTTDTGLGGGGRVALSVDVLGGFDPATQITARGGFNGCSSTSSSRRGAAPGTIYVSLAGDPFGRLLVDAGEYANGDDLPGLATALPELGGGPVAATEVSGPDLWVTGGAAFLTRWRGAWMALVDAAGAELGTFEVAEIDLAGRARLAGAGGVAGAASYRGEYRFDELRLVNGGDLSASDTLSVTSMTVDEGRSDLPRRLSAVDVTLLAGASAGAVEGTLEASITGTLTIEAGATLDVTGQGFAGGTSGSPEGGAPAGVRGSRTDAGGSHGGAGRFSYMGPPGEVYDSVFAPLLAGGGGANDEGTCCAGYAGGGVVLLDVGTLVLDGEIRSRGFSTGSIHVATGAGGTISVMAETLSGTGTIDASGGDQSTCTTDTGLGGGGRVALSVDVLSGFDPRTQVKAWGGANGCAPTSSSARTAAPGTIYLLQPGDLSGELAVRHSDPARKDGPHTILPSIGTGTIGVVEPDAADPTALWIEAEEIVLGDPVLFDPGVIGMWVRVAGSDYLVIEQSADRMGLLLADAAGQIAAGETYQGVYKFDRLAVLGGAVLVSWDLVEAPAVEVDADSQLITPIVDEEFHALADCAPVSGTAPLSVMFRSRGEIVNGAIERYRWDFEADGAYDTSDEVPTDRVRVLDTVGARFALLEVRNNLDEYALDRCLIAVHPNGPTAQAGAVPSTGPAPLTVNFTCTGSDAEGPIALYEWDFDGDGTYDFSSAASGSTAFTYTAEGEFVAVCRVTDGDGQTGLAPTADTVVRVTPPGSPTVEATAAPTTGVAPLLVTFSGNANDDGTIVLWEWDFEGDGVWDFSSAVGPDTTHTYAAGGLFAAALRVTDDQALTAIDNVGIFVEADATLSIPDDTFEPSAGETAAVDTSLTGDAAVRILIKDGAGGVRRVLVDEFRTAGSYSDLWDGTDDLGQPLAHGVYYAVLEYVIGEETRSIDHTNLTGGLRYSPSRSAVPSTFRPFENDPLEIDFTISAGNGASEVLAFVGLFNTSERFATLVNRVPFGVGDHRLVWDGIDAAGNLALPPVGDSLLLGMLAYTLPDNAIMLEAAPTISNVTVTPNLFDPATPDFIDPTSPTAEITYSLDKIADVELTVTNLETGVVLRQIVDPMVAAGTGLTIGWDGRAADGRFADRGSYRLTLRAVDSTGSVSLARLALVRVHY